MGFELPPRSSVGTLSAEIAGEGERVIHSDGSITTNWSPPPARLVMPDWSEIKSIRHYFNRKGHQVWPAWFYHPTEKPRLIRNAEDGADLGVCYRRATNEERGKYGVEAVWDWKDGCEWRPQPYHAPKFDPANPGHGKEYVARAPNPWLSRWAWPSRWNAGKPHGSNGRRTCELCAIGWSRVWQAAAPRLPSMDRENSAFPTR